MIGVQRKIDSKGRITLPANLIEAINDEEVNVYYIDGKIIIESYKKRLEGENNAKNTGRD